MPMHSRTYLIVMLKRSPKGVNTGSAGRSLCRVLLKEVCVDRRLGTSDTPSFLLSPSKDARMRCACLAACVFVLASAVVPAAEVTLQIDEPMSPPAWALLERSLLDANAAACRAFFERYFDERGYLLCVERWGGNDGPDD